MPCKDIPHSPKPDFELPATVEWAPACQAGAFLSHPSIFPKPSPNKRSQTVWGWLLLQQTHEPQRIQNISPPAAGSRPSEDGHEGDTSFRCPNMPSPSQGHSHESSRTHITGARNFRAIRMVNCCFQNILMTSK